MKLMNGIVWKSVLCKFLILLILIFKEYCEFFSSFILFSIPRRLLYTVDAWPEYTFGVSSVWDLLHVLTSLGLIIYQKVQQSKVLFICVAYRIIGSWNICHFSTIIFLGHYQQICGIISSGFKIFVTWENAGWRDEQGWEECQGGHSFQGFSLHVLRSKISVNLVEPKKKLWLDIYSSSFSS